MGSLTSSPVNPVLGESSTNTINRPLALQAPTDIDPQLLFIDPQLSSGRTIGTIKNAGNTNAEGSGSGYSIEMNEDWDYEQVLIDDMEIEAGEILSTISGMPSDTSISLQVGEEELQLDPEEMLLEDLGNYPIQEGYEHIHISATEFIGFFSRINIVRNNTAGHLNEQKFEQNAERWIPTGNSPNPPTRFVFCCPNKEWGCTYSSTIMVPLSHHLVSCQISAENPFVQRALNFPCRKDGCIMQFSNYRTRRTHEAEHGWTRCQCDQCTDGKFYETKNKFDYHMRRYHQNKWDSTITCPVPECGREAPSTSRVSYDEHLKRVHKMGLKERVQYKVAPPPKTTQPFGKRACPHQDCGSEDKPRKRARLEAHLRSSRVRGGHDLSAEEATKMVDDMLQQS
jgi:hypothetical protein